MTQTEPDDEACLLSLCTVLECFDLDLLRALGHADDQVTTLLQNEQMVLPAPGYAGFFQLRVDVLAAICSNQQAERAERACLHHEHAFTYFARCLHAPPALELRRIYEERCFYHLNALRVPLVERREWERIRAYVAIARKTRPQQARHRHLLKLYTADDAMRRQHYKTSVLILQRLIRQDDLAPDIRMRALNLLAQSYWFQTSYDQALTFYQQAHTLAQAIGDRIFQAHTLLNMSMIYHELGYYEQAFTLSKQSLHAYRAIGDQQHEAHALYEVGKNAMQLGHWHEAQDCYAASATLYVHLDVPAQLANLYCLKAMLAHALGDEHWSETWYLRSLAIGQSEAHGDIAVAMDAWLLLGLLYQTQRRWSEAMAAYQSAAALAQRSHNFHSLALTHFRRGDIHKAQGSAAAAAACYNEAIVLLESLRSAATIEEVKLGLLGATQHVYESMVLLCYEHGHVVDAFNYVERARARALLDLLQQKEAQRYAAVEQPVVTLQELQARLPEGSLVLEYFTIGVVPRGEHLLNYLPAENTQLREHLVLPPQVLIFAITHDHVEVHRAALNPNTLRPQPFDPGPGRRFVSRPMRESLYRRLLAPVAQLIDRCDTLLLIPHGPLHYVPFAALCAGDGQTLLAASGPVLALAPSSTILLRNCLDRPQNLSGGFLALGYNDQGDAALLYAEAEAQASAQLMGGISWTGPDAKRERLAARGQQMRWIHFAGHAVYEPHDPLASALRLGANDALSARAIMQELELQAEVVTLSACTTGLSHVVPGDELLGLPRALLYAGAATVVCTLWEATDLITFLLMERFYIALKQGQRPAEALRDAQVAVRELTGQDVIATIKRWQSDYSPGHDVLAHVAESLHGREHERLFADPFYWAPFMVIGRP